MGVADGVELELVVAMPGAEVTLAVAMLVLAALETIDAGAVKIPVGIFDSSIFVGATTIPPVTVGAVVVEEARAEPELELELELESESESESELEYSPVLSTLKTSSPPPYKTRILAAVIGIARHKGYV